MEYINGAELARMLGVTPRRIQQMCKTGELKGAIKEGKSWKIPRTELLKHEHLGDGKKKPLPVGISDFKRATSDYYYVDKTLLIRDFLDSKPQVSLFTRPRRFGKTLNMDMLRVFFERTDEDTSTYFKDKAIWNCGKEYTDYQGKYPVIYLSFKDVKHSVWDKTYKNLAEQITAEFLRHPELETSEKLSQYEKAKYSVIASGKADMTDYQLSLKYLSMYLSKHYGIRSIIIIDEYDTPIHQGYISGYYDEIVEFMRGLFSGGLKDNQCLEYGFLTGILRVAKESIFSGLNNLKIYSIIDEGYSEYFGFTGKEVEDMLSYYGYADRLNEVCEWYDGYKFGNTEIFNPWSVINYISEKCFPKAYWIATGSNDIIGEVIAGATTEIEENLHTLLRGNAINTFVDTDVIYPEIKGNPNRVFSFLLVAGYLKIAKVYPQASGNYLCDVSIPNKEISFVYEREIIERFGATSVSAIAMSIQQAIFKKDIGKLGKLLGEYMLDSISYFDTSSEGFYHGMMLGLCAIVSNSYRVRSNQESGYGRFDISLIPNTVGLPGYIFEFKHSKNKETDLKELAGVALTQIETQKYETEMTNAGIREIVKVGVAFRGKDAELAWK